MGRKQNLEMPGIQVMSLLFVLFYLFSLMEPATLIGDSKLAVNVTPDGCVCLCVSHEMHWKPARGEPSLSPWDRWVRLYRFKMNQSFDMNP